MPLTAAQQQDIIKLGVGMFNASVGGFIGELATLLAPPTGTGLTTAQFYDALANTSAFKGLNFAYSAASTNAQFATFFAGQILGSTVTDKAEAIAFITGLLDGGQTRGSAIKAAVDFLGASTTLTDTKYGAAAQQFVNKVTVATDFTITKSGSSTTLSVLQATIASVTNVAATVTAATTGNTAVIAGETKVFTTSLDVLTGGAGNDTFIGDNNTVSAADQVEGGSGTDTLKLFSTVTLPAFTNVETLFLSAPAADLDVSAKTQITSLQIDSEAMAATRAYTVASTQALTLTNISGHAANEMDIKTAATTTAQTITVDKVGSSALDLILDINGAAVTALTLATANNASFIELKNNATTVLTTLTVTGDKALTVDADTSNANLTKVDASANTGGVAVTLDVTTNKNVTFTGGTGNDKVMFGNSLLETDSADGGAGTDTVGVNDGTHITVAAGAKLLNFETLDIAGAAASTYTMTRLSGITKVINSAATAAAVTIADLADTASVEIGAALGAALTVQQKDSGVGSPNDTMAVTINAATAVTTGFALVVPDIESVTLNSTSSGTSITHISTDATFAAATSVAFNASTAGLTVAAITAANSVLFDASASAKAVSLTLSAQNFTTNSGVEVKGGAGSDTIVFTNVTAFAAGQDSNLATPTFDQIKVTGGKGGDAITVRASIDSDQYTFVYAAGDSVTVVGATAGFSATATDKISAIANNATYADAAGNRLIIDTEVSATAVAAITTTAPTFGTTTVTNAGDFLFYRDTGTTTDAYVYQDTNGNKVIDAGEFSVKLVGAGADHWANETLSIASGNLVIVTVA